MSPETKKAEVWNNPQILKDVEKGRYIAERALNKVIGDAFRRHLTPDAMIFEAGAGLGYLKTFVPQEFYTHYLTSDYSAANLREGSKMRSLTAVAASAYELPLGNSSVDCVVDMDAYDTLSSLGRALVEAKRVLKPGGTYLHFQINYPSDDTVEEDYPNYVFFPAKFVEGGRHLDMIGMKKGDLAKGITYIKTPPYKGIMEDFLKDPEGAYIRAITFRDPKRIVEIIHACLDAMPLDKLVVPSLSDYFKDKLERLSSQAGLLVTESGFRCSSILTNRSRHQTQYPQYNQFELTIGSSNITQNSELVNSGSKQIIEKAAILVFAARKAV